MWDDAGVGWAAFDLVVVRSAWDYAERRDAFLEWAASLPRVLNPLPVLEWSTDKGRYLRDLAAAGVPTVPTAFVDPGEPFPRGAPDQPQRNPRGPEAPPPLWRPFAVKPAVSAGGRSSAWFDDVDAGAELVRRIHADGRTAMIQPYLGEVTETALVFVGGSYSHALRRQVGLPAAGAQDLLYLEEELGPAEASAAEREIAEHALTLAPGRLLYGRVDIAAGMVLELELAEPSLYLSFGEGAVERFAASIAREAAASQRRRISEENGPTTSQ